MYPDIPTGIGPMKTLRIQYNNRRPLKRSALLIYVLTREAQSPRMSSMELETEARCSFGSKYS